MTFMGKARIGKWGRGRWLAAGLLALPASVTGIGCASQVSDDYAGEVMLTIEGNVNIESAGDLELKLAFYNAQGTGIDVMEGHASGEFPAKFKFEVTAPPPKAALLRADGAPGGITGEIAIGFLVLLPPGHPATIPDIDDADSVGCAEEGEDELSCLDVTQCAGEVCRQRRLSCTKRYCEQYESDGDPMLKESIPFPVQAVAVCSVVPYCYSTSTWCSSLDNCYHEYSDCDVTQVDAYDSLDYDFDMKPYIRDCELVEESGEPFLSVSDIQTAANGYVIVYATKDNPNTVMGHLKAGYNVVEVGNMTREQWVEDSSCEAYDPNEAWSEEPSGTCDADATIKHWRVVEDHTLSLNLGGPPSIF